jgi:hypothetical protein
MAAWRPLLLFSAPASDVFNTMRTAVLVESLANISELHEPLALDGIMAPGAVAYKTCS